MNYIKLYENYHKDLDFTKYIKQICVDNNLSFEYLMNETYFFNTLDNISEKYTLINSIKNNKIEVSRVVSMSKDDFLNKSFKTFDFGVYWSWMDGHPYGGRDDDNLTYYVDFRGLVDISDIDWVETIKANISAYNESEINIKRGSSVLLNSYSLYKDDNSIIDEFSTKNFWKKNKINLKITV